MMGRFLFVILIGLLWYIFSNIDEAIIDKSKPKIFTVETVYVDTIIKYYPKYYLFIKDSNRFMGTAIEVNHVD